MYLLGNAITLFDCKSSILLRGVFQALCFPCFPSFRQAHQSNQSSRRSDQNAPWETKCHLCNLWLPFDGDLFRFLCAKTFNGMKNSLKILTKQQIIFCGIPHEIKYLTYFSISEQDTTSTFFSSSSNGIESPLDVFTLLHLKNLINSFYSVFSVIVFYSFYIVIQL